MLEFNEAEKKIALDGLALVTAGYRAEADRMFTRLGALPENRPDEVDFVSNQAHSSQDMAEATERVAQKIREGSYLTGKDIDSVRQGLYSYRAANRMAQDTETQPVNYLIMRVENELMQLQYVALSVAPLPFAGNESMWKLLGLLAQAEMPRQRNSISELMLFISGMEQQLDNAYAQLRKFKQEIASVREIAPQKSVAEASKLATRAEWTLNSVRNGLNDLKTDLIYAAQNMADKVKGVGLTALSKLADFLNVRESLEGLKKDLHTSASLIAEGTSRLEGVTKELRAAADHAKNAGRALAGKEQAEMGVAQPHFSGLHKIHDTLVSMEKGVDTGISQIDALKHAAEKPSVKRSLQKKPDEKKAPTVPAKQKENAPEL